MRVWWRIVQRFYAARHRRAARQLGPWASEALHFKQQSEKFFHKIKGARKI